MRTNHCKDVDLHQPISTSNHHSPLQRIIHHSPSFTINHHYHNYNDENIHHFGGSLTKIHQRGTIAAPLLRFASLVSGRARDRSSHGVLSGLKDRDMAGVEGLTMASWRAKGWLIMAKGWLGLVNSLGVMMVNDSWCFLWCLWSLNVMVNDAYWWFMMLDCVQWSFNDDLMILSCH